MSINKSVALLFTMLLASSGFAYAQDAAKASAKSKTVTVNGVAIPQARIDFAMKQRTSQGQPDSPETRKAIVDQLVNLELGAQEATRKGLNKNAEVAAQLELSRESVLIQAYLQDYIKNHPVSEADLKKEYEKGKASVANDKEYKARHILVEKEDDAKAIIAQLKKGAKFEELAKQSKDPGSKDKGGDLDWSPSANYVKPFADALTKLEKGKMTETPVQTQFGWHVIQLDDVRPVTIPPFEEVKPNIKQNAERLQVEKAIADLRAKAKISE